MNAYMNSCTNVGYNQNTSRREYSKRRAGEGLISFICTIVDMVTCSAAIKIEKTIVVFSLFVAFFGVLGGIENGSLSWLFGIALCSLISLLEYVTLKSIFKPMVKGE